jgi:hypothetical protein
MICHGRCKNSAFSFGLKGINGKCFRHLCDNIVIIIMKIFSRVGLIFVAAYIILNIALYLFGFFSGSVIIGFLLIATLVFPGALVTGIDGPTEYIPALVLTVIIYYLLGTIVGRLITGKWRG